MSKKIRTVMAVVAVMLLIAPLTIGATEVIEGEGKNIKIQTIGSWKETRLLGMEFVPVSEDITISNTDLYFIIKDERLITNRFCSDVMYSKDVYLIDGRDIRNATSLKPDDNKIYHAEFSSPGIYYVVVDLTSLPVPFLGDALFPCDQDILRICVEEEEEE